MARLPIPGKDSGTWGDVLNDYLKVSHASDGTLKDGIVSESTLDVNVVAKLNAPASIADNSITAAMIQDGAITNTKVTGIDASKVTTGTIANERIPDLSGTYISPNGANIARFINRARAGETLTITCVGDSVLEGQTVTNPSTDGCMILLPADLSTRFSNTVTSSNHATSGFTALRAFTDTNLAAAITDQADLYIISAFDKNDLGADISGTGGLYAPGYPQVASLAAIERAVRDIRRDVPKADIIIMSTNPYTAGSSSNPYQTAKDTAVRRIAAAYGCEFVDGYGAFIAKGDYSSYMADSTHPNTLGHRLLADTLLSHFPLSSALVPIMTAQPGIKGLYNPDKFSDSIGSYGAMVTLVTGTFFSGALMWTNTGAWTGTGGSSPYTSSTVGDYTEVTFKGIELHLLMSTTLADSPVCDIAVDGVTVATNQGFTNGKNGTYYVPIAVGLTAAMHTIRLTIKSGTLKIQRIAAFAAALSSSFTPATVVVDLTGTISTISIDSTGTVTKVIDAGSVPLPGGWTSMNVVFTGFIRHRIQSTTTTNRQLQTVLRRTGSGGGARVTLTDRYQPVTTTTNGGTTLAWTEVNLTASTTWNLEISQVDTDKTNGQVTTWGLQAICHRLS